MLWLVVAAAVVVGSATLWAWSTALSLMVLAGGVLVLTMVRADGVETWVYRLSVLAIAAGLLGVLFGL
jgi:hypothetical protein